MKKIWITGGSTGIGKALALKFAKEGWQVAISARRENLLNQICESNKNKYPLGTTLAVGLGFFSVFNNSGI